MRRVLFVFILLFCSGLARAGTPPEDICQKLSTGHAGRESQPPYRLRCERAEDGSERVQLLIDGKKPLMLAGVGGEPLASQEVIFDPVSVTVRLLEGQPNLYWIRYGHTSLGAGGVDVDNQRHWVVQKGDTGRTVFDKWTKVYENNRGGNFSSTSEDVAIEYRGSTLRVINTRFRGEAVEDDLHEPGEPGYRESGSTESLVKATREIGASTGRMILEKTIWAKANGDYLLLDDGVAGWLLVTNPDFRLASWQPGEMLPRNRIPDLGKLEEIPAVAACWLYNRIPWTPANLPRTRPPAPPEQVRPGHFVPENCCNLETSADGKQVFFYDRTYALTSIV
jgi:hypothetical protein